MKRIIGLATALVLLTAFAAASDNQDAFFGKNDIDQIIVRQFAGDYDVIVLLKAKVNGFDGFYYTDFASYLEAITFGDLFRRGRIKGVQHYPEGSGQTAWWNTKRIAIISRFYMK